MDCAQEVGPGAAKERAGRYLQRQKRGTFTSLFSDLNSSGQPIPNAEHVVIL